ncbi:hypothetical protein Ais01nite_60340 [Asanoa ishikariensis]|uniref:CopC domain-containing protein n=1 Tax=Asanoa ishikariensis TaxID=137265 RepID=A0A1H3PAF4_9ACTN|nr:hypothetical protein [Asanoa ishikariensis]GIF67999.1 hypothetical protein Ais01nite_60340 [Asanoa ishikariensis]SDY97805.1 hypothetical protein SAMN05421684_2694 [Asanoa ishikariensis]
MSVIRFVAALFAAALLALVPGLPAYAHDGPVTLDVASDGAGGVTVRAIYTKDKHPVEQAVGLVLNATGEGGRSVGPIQLNPSAEGRGFYTSGPVLTPGEWAVSVTAPDPHPGKAQVKIEAKVAQQMPPAAAADLDAGTSLADRLSWLWWLGGAVLVIFVLGAIAQNRTTRSKNPT